MFNLSFKAWYENIVTNGAIAPTNNMSSKTAVQQASQQAANALQQSGDKNSAIKKYNQSIMQQMAQGKINPQELNNVLADKPQDNLKMISK